LTVFRADDFLSYELGVVVVCMMGIVDLSRVEERYCGIFLFKSNLNKEIKHQLTVSFYEACTPVKSDSKQTY